ncbi:MAG: lysophospholipid acyltransferase family protein [Nevskia sp.]|nr:lysophospholipid acyltransferase family protein [Nevskia sp.]
MTDYTSRSGPDRDSDPGIATERSVRGTLSDRATRNCHVGGADAEYMSRIRPAVDFMMDRYFRVETTGWENLPEGPCLLVGIHSGTWLTMDAWSFVLDWWRHFGESRLLHGTAHDALMAMPGLGAFFCRVGVIPAGREQVTSALASGHDVVVWPGGEVDAMRNWKDRNKVLLAGRRGFVKQAILSGVPIVPVATVGGADTVFVLSEGRWLAKALQLKKLVRSEIAPIVAGLPFGIWPELLPSHIPLPAKIVNEILPPIRVSQNPESALDDVYVNRIYAQVQEQIQASVDRLAKKRRYPIFG